MLQPLTLANFAGGLTDFIKGSPANRLMLAENLLIDEMGFPFARWGSRLYDDANGRPAVTTRIGSLWNFDEETALLAQNARKVFRYSAGWTELTGPSANPAFGAGTESARTSSFEWQGHRFITNDASSSVMKIFRTGASTYKVMNAGLKAFQSETLYSQTTAGASIAAMAVAIRAAMLAHYANTTTTVHAVPGGAATPDTAAAALITLTDVVTGDTLATTIAKVTEYQLAYRAHYTDATKAQGSRSYHANTYEHPGAPNTLLDQPTPPETFLEVAQILNDIKRKHNWHVRSHKGHFNTTALDAYGRPTAAVGGANHQVSVADLAGVEEGPLFTEISYAALVAAVNRVKTAWNAHLESSGALAAHNTTLMLTAATDTENQITLADATEQYSAYEMVAHIYSGYRHHHADAALPAYTIAGVGTFPANTDRIGTVSFVSPTGLAFDVLKVGMYLDFTNDVGAGPTWAPAKGLKIGTVDKANNRITVVDSAGAAAANDGSGASGSATSPIYTSEHKYHLEQYTALTVSEIASGALESLDFATYARDLGTVVDALNDIVTKMNSHMSNYGRAVGTAGPHPQFTTSAIASLGLTVYRYLYGFIFSHEYTTVAGKLFRVVSKPYLKTKVALRSVTDTPTSFTGLDTIANGATENYDTGNIKIEVYRSENNEAVLRYVGETTNGTDTFIDAVGDEELRSNEALYTSGGVVDADPTPKAKFIHMVGDFAYYGNLLSDPLTTETLPNRIRQAVGGSPEQCPGDFFVDLPGAVKGLSSVSKIPIAFTTDQVFRLQGFFNELGQGGIIAIPIPTRTGLAGENSPLQVEGGVVFAGHDGFYFTDGYRVSPFNMAWPATYAGLVSTTQRKGNIVGTYDKLSSRAFFAATTTGTENNKIFALDLNQPVDPRIGACWTAWSNGDSFAPTALCVFGGQLIRGDSRGYVLKHDASYTSDPGIVAASTVTGFMKTVTYQLRTPALELGTEALRIWMPFIECKFENEGSLSAQWKVLNDAGRTTGSCTPIRVRSPSSQINEKRYFPSRSIWGNRKQIELTNAFVVIARSDDYALATVTLTTTVTIAAGAFPSDMVDHKIYFAADGYVTGYTITNQTVGDTVLTVSGAPANVAGSKWLIRGYPKTEKMRLSEFSVWWNQMGANQSGAFGESGENA